MEKRLLLTFLISLGILGAWTLLQQRFAPPPQVVPPTAEPVAPPPSPAGGGTPAGEKAAVAPPVPAAERPKEERTVIEHKDFYRAEFTTWGAAPTQIVLLKPAYKMTVNGKDVPINLVENEDRPPFLTWFEGAGDEARRSGFDVPPRAAWTLVEKSNEKLRYTLDAGPVHLEKTWTFPAGTYEMHVELTVKNNGDKPLPARTILAVDGFQDPNVEMPGLSGFGRRVNMHSAECDVSEKVRRVSRGGGGGCGGGGDGKSWSAPINETGDLYWVGINEQYFLLAAALGTDANGATCHAAGEPSGRITATAIYPSKTLAPGEQMTTPFVVYAGPKQFANMDAVSVDGRGPKQTRLSDSLNYTLEAIARPLGWVLIQIQKVVINWGLAIIVITVLLKLLLLYPTQKSMRSMKEMAKLKPKIDALKAKYPDDTARQQQEMMAIYKQHGVNPLGSCLPMLLQLPIYLAFYSMLSNAVELYRASLWPGGGPASLWWPPLTDMTAPYPPLAVVTGILMYVQQKLAPQTGGDPAQQKMLQYMPLIFSAMTLMLPSGLTLYIFTNTLLTMLQQWWNNRGEAKTPSGGGGGSSGGGKNLKPARA